MLYCIFAVLFGMTLISQLTSLSYAVIVGYTLSGLLIPLALLTVIDLYLTYKRRREYRRAMQHSARLDRAIAQQENDS